MNPDPDPEFLHKVAGDKKKKSFFFHSFGVFLSTKLGKRVVSVSARPEEARKR